MVAIYKARLIDDRERQSPTAPFDKPAPNLASTTTPHSSGPAKPHTTFYVGTSYDGGSDQRGDHAGHNGKFDERGDHARENACRGAYVHDTDWHPVCAYAYEIGDGRSGYWDRRCEF